MASDSFGDGCRVRGQHDRHLYPPLRRLLKGIARLKLGTLERYDEVLNGAFIALVGVAFGLWPAF